MLLSTDAVIANIYQFKWVMKFGKAYLSEKKNVKASLKHTTLNFKLNTEKRNCINMFRKAVEIKTVNCQSVTFISYFEYYDNTLK